MNNPFETIDAKLSNIESLLLDLKYPKNNSLAKDRKALLNIRKELNVVNKQDFKTIESLLSNLSEIFRIVEKALK